MIDNFYTDEGLDSEIRDIKLKFITDEIPPFSIKMDAVKKFLNSLDFLSSEFPEEIITGSLALNLFGLIDRDVKDLDIIIDESKLDADEFFLQDGLYGFDDEISDSRIGQKSITYKHKWYKKRTYVVDLFAHTNQTYIEFEYKGVKLKIHNPLEILKSKISMVNNSTSVYSGKHKTDIWEVLNIINKNNK